MFVILFATEATWVARILSYRSFVGVGLISYSAYLWHQPVFAFLRLRSFTEPSPLLTSGLVASVFLLAWATWHFVEQPFRRRKNPVLLTRRSVFLASGATGVVVLTIGLYGQIYKGLPFRGMAKRV